MCAGEPRGSSVGNRLLATAIFATMAVLLAMLVGANLTSLREGFGYLYQAVAWDPDAVEPLEPDGPYGICHELVHMANAQRRDAIVRELESLGLHPSLLPISGSAMFNILVTFQTDGPYRLFVAHYDKSRDTPTYQGASDNTAAVCAMLGAARDLATRVPANPTALLFSGDEERGMLGAESFLAWAPSRAMVFSNVVNFDMIGRGKLAIRPSADPGFQFWLPGVGQVVYDGRRLWEGTPFPQPDSRLIAELAAIMGSDLVSFRRFTASSDSNVFQRAGLPVVSVSSSDMYYPSLIWERDADRIELLDERNLALAHKLIVKYADAS